MRRFQTGFWDGNYGLPSGHGEPGESIREGVAREAREEIGISIDTRDLEFVLTQNRWCPDPGNPHARVGFYFIPRAFSGQLRNIEPHKCDDLRFFPLANLPENMVPHVRAAIQAYIQGQKYNEFDWDTRNISAAF